MGPINLFFQYFQHEESDGKLGFLNVEWIVFVSTFDFTLSHLSIGHSGVRIFVTCEVKADLRFHSLADALPKSLSIIALSQPRSVKLVRSRKDYSL